jgi:solute carrier family 8 (sodium/calcium exchanger)
VFSGYVCFVVCIFCIGCLTAVIGDVASHFGCTVGVKDAVTAITFVALGTSVPGKGPPCAVAAGRLAAAVL